LASSTLHDLNHYIQGEADFLKPLTDEIRRVIIGQERLITRLLIALISDGHILIEGVPGLAKTLSIRTLAQAIDCSFQRIQFTPDLLPSDLLGTQIYLPELGTFDTRLGPVFTNFLLADEINRAPAKVQSALLEAMEERQITLGERSHAISRPFLVMATQNPIEQEGTYPLPEAQLDRFMLKTVVKYPRRADEKLVIEQLAQHKPPEVAAVAPKERILRAQQVIRSVYVDDRITEYILDIVTATRSPGQYGLTALEPYLDYGASPRASIGLAIAGRALAFLNGRGYVIPDDIKQIAPDILRHRIVLSFAAFAENQVPDQIIDQILQHLAVR
jgi:MoxR-like ATPase